ncbi:hypothetical protein B5M09_012630 [Aphanomyces astaci]|uniref:Uncharacterized protein n=1 Tax=Aphanomyces astaci TaxID=112090 RepID=A0A3R7YIS1_APHAT|nr:hypothetical protein B5M09_012630 [Aphanomyces astaci]
MQHSHGRRELSQTHYESAPQGVQPEGQHSSVARGERYRCDPKLTKAELLVMVTTSRDGPRYAPQLIATEYGHTLYYTPPYHPELQPIEIIWGIVKQKMARRLSTSMADMDARLKKFMSEVPFSQLVSAHRKAQAFEGKYAEVNDDDIRLAGSDSDSDSCGRDGDVAFLLGEESGEEYN